VAFAPNGDFFVGDGYGSHHVLKFSSAGANSSARSAVLATATANLTRRMDCSSIHAARNPSW
jgi:hypothetical protein